MQSVKKILLFLLGVDSTLLIYGIVGSTSLESTHAWQVIISNKEHQIRLVGWVQIFLFAQFFQSTCVLASYSGA